MRAAFRNGVTREEIREVLLQSAMIMRTRRQLGLQAGARGVRPDGAEEAVANNLAAGLGAVLPS